MVSNPIEITVPAGPPTQLTITVQPSILVVRSVQFSQQPVIQVRDASGNSVSQAGIEVTASIESGPDKTKLEGTRKIVTDDLGVAAFTDLSINRAGSFTLRFSSGSLAPVVSNTILVIP